MSLKHLRPRCFTMFRSKSVRVRRMGFTWSSSWNHIMSIYCWWKKFQTTTRQKYETHWNPVNDGIFYISTGAGFLSSRVCLTSNQPATGLETKAHFLATRTRPSSASLPNIFSASLWLWIFHGDTGISYSGRYKKQQEKRQQIINTASFWY